MTFEVLTWAAFPVLAPAEGELAQIRTLLRAEGLALVLGIVIAAIGLGVLSLAALQWKSKGPLLLSFGLFSTLYGSRLLASTLTVRGMFSVAPRTWVLVEVLITDVIVIPFLIFLRELSGNVPKSYLGWLIWFFVTYAPIAITSDLARRGPGPTPDPATLLLAIGFLTLVACLVLRRFPRGIFDRSEEAALVIGCLAFLLFVVYEHLVNWNVVPWRARVEPLGFFIFLCTLGYVMARRFFQYQRQLLAVEQEMAAARRIQSSILPQELPRVENLTLAVRYVPMAAVAGDFYDFHVAGKKQLGILVADTIGHGVPAALVASMVKVAFALQAASAADPAAVLTEMNRFFCQQGQEHLITAGYLYLDLERGEAVYAGSGHPPLLVWRKAATRLQEVEQNGVIMGFRPDATYTNVTLELRAGDCFLLYTDGVTEAQNSQGEFFGETRFREVIQAYPHVSPETFASCLLEELYVWTNANPEKGYDDDLTVVVAQVAG